MSGELAELTQQLVEEGVTQGEAAVGGAAAGGVFGAIAGFLAGAMLVVGIVALIVALLRIIAWWRIFTKAGEKGWKALIPILDSYTATKIAGTNNFARIIIAFLGYAICNGISTALDPTSAGALIAGIISLALLIWYVVEIIIRFNGIAKNYGKGTGFVVAWVFFPTITTLILGLGGSQYKKIN